MYQLILMIHIIVAICLVALVLVQQGRGATMGAAFGSGASQTVFGSRGSGSFLLKVTIGFVVVFFITGIVLNRLVTQDLKQQKTAEIVLPVQQDTEKTGSPNNIPQSPSTK
jgi:preprotein translocase subunit SecG